MLRSRTLRIRLCLGWWLTVASVAHVPGGEAGRPTCARATVYGAARQVSGSLTVLDTGTAQWLIDCGAQYPEGAEDDRAAQAERRSAALPVDARAVAAVLITHAHLDHTGRLPLLVQRGFAGPIYMTAATRELVPIMLDMQVRYDRGRVREWAWSQWSSDRAQAGGSRLTLHWRSSCMYRQKIDPGNLRTAQGSLADVPQRLGAVEVSTCGSCAKDEVSAILALGRVVKYATPVELAPGVTATFLDAGHIPGSASILFRIDLPRTPRSILFSGDLGNNASGLLPGPQPAPAADAVFVETTYGPVQREPAAHTERARFRREVAEVVRRGGVAWIPAFALDRTQKMLFELRLAQQEGLLPTDAPILCPSPTAREITAIYRQHQDAGWFHAALARDGSALAPAGLVEGRRLLQDLPRPCVLLTTSGMMDRASSADLTAELLPQESTAVFLVSYQDPDSTGGRLHEGCQSVLVNGREVPVRAKVRAYSCFSAHADGRDLDGWLAHIHRDAKVVLVHGEPERIDARRTQMLEAGWKDVAPALEGQPIDLQPHD